MSQAILPPLAVLIDPGKLSAFAGLLDDCALPMLTLGTKPIVQHWVERLSEAGIKHFLMMVDNVPEKTRAFLGNGERWGVEIQYANIRKGQAHKAQISMVPSEDYGQVFIAQMAGFPKISLAEDLRDALSTMDVVSVDGIVHWTDQFAEQHQGALCKLDTEHVRLIDHPKAYWLANMDILSGKLEDPLPFGFPVGDGSWIASNCKVQNTVRSFPPIFLGENSILSKGVVIGPNVVVADRCVLDVGAFVKDSVVLSRTFIGSHIAIQNMIVSGDTVYRAEDDIFLHINDLEILAKNAHAHTSVTLLERLLAFISLLVLLLPSALVALQRKLTGKDALRNGTVYIEHGRDLNGYRQFKPVSVTSLNVSHRLWRKVPWLINVLRAELALVGSSPRINEAVEYPCWVSDAEDFVAGVISQADLVATDNDSFEEVVIADAYQLTRGEVGPHVGMWLKWLAGLFSFKH
jgi:NDP-sugar pyrophosphorylase family protein